MWSELAVRLDGLIIGYWEGTHRKDTSTPPHRVVVPGSFMPHKCVFIDGERSPVSKQTFNLLHLLSTARQENSIVRLTDIQAICLDARKVLTRLKKKLGESAEVIQFPGGKGKGGYRLL